MPDRIQLRRVKGFRLPNNAIVVSRPGKWGNPYTAMDCQTQYPSLTDHQSAGMLVAQFRDLMHVGGALYYPNWLSWGGHRGPFDVTYPVDHIRSELAGHDLACWCPLDQPCHADVLLEIANKESV